MHNCGKFIGLVFTCLSLLACTSTVKTEQVKPSHYVDAQKVDRLLLQTAQSIQKSIRVMETTTNAQALKGMSRQEIIYAKEQMAKVPTGMEALMTTNTYASLRALVADAAAQANYRFEEYGKPKKLYLTMDTSFRPVVDVLRDAGNQVRDLAWICVYPSPSPSQNSNGVLAIKYDGDCKL